MKSLYLLLGTFFLVTACGPVPQGRGETIAGCTDTLENMSALLDGYDLPEYFRVANPVKQGGEFDVMQYFTVLDHLSMQPGYVLDYVYHFDGLGGYPVLYARPAGQPPFATEADLGAVGGEGSYLDFVRADDTPEALFQFVLLAMKAGQFYLDWHANYNDTRLVCDRAAVSAITASLDGQFYTPMSLVSRLRSYLLRKIAPTVSIDRDTARVSIVTFTLWGGFYRETYTLTRGTRLEITDVQETNLVPYQCGVMF